MKPAIDLLLLLAIAITSHSASSQDQWRTLFDGKSLKGWKANLHPESFTVANGAIRARSIKDRAHLFYVGDREESFTSRATP
jgi:hypothetical protein